MKKIKERSAGMPWTKLKFDLKMKLSLFLLIVTLFQVQANSSYSQKVTLELEDVTLKEVINEIESKTEYRFLYSEEEIDLTERVSIKFKKRSIEDVLTGLLKNTNIMYQRLDRQIILRKLNDKKVKTSRSQGIEVNGLVTNKEGQSLPGVTVLIKNTNRGVSTDFNGEYRIMVPDKQSVLVFSSLGFKLQEIRVGDQSILNVTLEESVGQLNEVVLNAGYYNVTERERTGNISRVTAKEIENQPVLNPLAAIQGRMPGVEITQSTGVPGGGFEIKIRGTNSLRTNGNNPLYILDGVPFTSEPITNSSIVSAQIVTNPLNSINPSDIESIEVLKDADATAIYGSRAANGVVLITTKSGKSGNTKLNINTLTGVGQVSNYMDLLSTEQYLELRREAYANASLEPTAAGAPDLLLWDQDRETNWQQKLIGGTANIRNIQTSLSGGSDQLSFRAGAGFREETTVFPRDFYNRKFSGNLSFRHNPVNSNFRASVSSLFTIDQSTLPKQDLTLTALTLPPNAPELFEDDGSLNWENSTWTNPLAALEENYNGRVNNLVINSVLGYQISNGLEVTTNLGYTNMNATQVQITPQTAFDPAQELNRRASNRNESQLDTWIVEPQLNYKAKFGEFDFDALVGATIQETKRTANALNATGFSSDALLENLQAASSFRIINSRETNYKYRALFGRLHLDYKDKYLINLTGRGDGSSRFGPGREYGNFGAIGTAWIFSEEKLIKEHLAFLNFGKVRFSYGTTGSDQIGDYQYLDLYRPGFYTYNGQNGINPTRIANPNFGWETNRKLEWGLELGLFEKRINFSGSYYSNESSNQLVGLPLPGTTGFTSVQSNFPATVSNTGLEIQLNTQNIDTQDFSWNTSFNISFPRNELKEYKNFEASPYANQYTIGKPLSIIRNFNYLGVDPETGLYDFEDINGDGFVSFPNDLIDITDLDPEYYGGLNNSLQYKNWQLDFFLQFARQKGLSYYNSFQSPGSRSNQPAEIVNRWRNAGDEATFQMASVGFNSAFFSYLNATGTSFNITDASYLRLKNISLSYQLPSINNIQSRIYFQGQNVLTLTDFKGLDPENAGRTQLPPLRFYAVGIDINL